MMERSAIQVIARACLVGGMLLIAGGCRGPLAPTPGFGKEVRANRLAMRENPDATTRNVGPVDGIDPATAEGVLENYHYNEEAETQGKRQSAGKKSDIKF